MPCQKGGGGNFKLVVIQSSHRFGLAARSQICLNPVWRVGSEGSRSEPELPEAEHSEAAGPEPTQPNWIQTNLAAKRRDQTGGLIES
ncbi:MAG: hypothetical protein GY696_40720 [Gammaproteobacteria bacterium]|nr:hypothetical protein [Gammaproteobacteria bacterium]